MDIIWLKTVSAMIDRTAATMCLMRAGSWEPTLEISPGLACLANNHRVEFDGNEIKVLAIRIKMLGEY